MCETPTLKKYSVYSLNEKWQGAITFSYYPNSVLAAVEYPELINDDTHLYFAQHLPITLDIFNEFVVAHKERIKVFDITVQVAIDLSFESFWNTYAHKKGSKDKAMDFWYGEKRTYSGAKITDQDQREILSQLPKYLQQYTGEQKKYQPHPCTYLYQRLWMAFAENNEVKPKKELTTRFLEKRNLQPIVGISLQEYLESKPPDEIGLLNKLVGATLAVTEPSRSVVTEPSRSAVAR